MSRLVLELNKVYMHTILSRPTRGGGGRGGKIPGPGLVWGPEILIKHLVIALLSRGLGPRNA